MMGTLTTNTTQQHNAAMAKMKSTHIFIRALRRVIEVLPLQVSLELLIVLRLLLHDPRRGVIHNRAQRLGNGSCLRLEQRE